MPLETLYGQPIEFHALRFGCGFGKSASVLGLRRLISSAEIPSIQRFNWPNPLELPNFSLADQEAFRGTSNLARVKLLLLDVLWDTLVSVHEMGFACKAILKPQKYFLVIVL